MDGLEVIETPTRQQLAAEHLILSICIANHFGPDDLDRLAHRLADMNAIADARTVGTNHEHYLSRR
ncbi:MULTISPECIES: hypothetical protein [unclassified Serratia (in: enterobacteria)]|uniref:hypothetical protein n=1 Tax=unclassified Serratia (in: enterobacteria) TaxID=2647522 RepID=UPI000AEF985E|nr:MULTISPECIES: hypothetical protein [unclassified Serratia (in: enterobacteria)]